MMMFRSVCVCCLFWLGMAAAVEGAITMVVVPDGLGGTTYTFEEMSANPLVPVSMVLSSGFRMELPPGMFVASGPGSGGAVGVRWLRSEFFPEFGVPEAPCWRGGLCRWIEEFGAV